MVEKWTGTMIVRDRADFWSHDVRMTVDVEPGTTPQEFYDMYKPDDLDRYEVVHCYVSVSFMGEPDE